MSSTRASTRVRLLFKLSRMRSIDFMLGDSNFAIAKRES
jgi:hypothetical protein